MKQTAIYSSKLLFRRTHEESGLTDLIFTNREKICSWLPNWRRNSYYSAGNSFVSDTSRPREVRQTAPQIMSTRTHPTKHTYFVVTCIKLTTLLAQDVSETHSRKSELSAGFDVYIYIYIYIYIPRIWMVKFTLEQAKKSQNGSRGIALLFL